MVEHVRDHIPLEQGLRLMLSFVYFNHNAVRDHIPLEQGLRPETETETETAGCVRDHIPLEQGLRQHGSKVRLIQHSSETIFH